MASHTKLILTSLLIKSMVLAGCAESPIRTFRPIKTVDLNHVMETEALSQNIENIYVLVDASTSMKEAYHGNAFAGDDFPGDPKPTKFSVAREILLRMNNSLEGLNINTALRRFGFGPCLGWRTSRLDYPLAAHNHGKWLSSLGDEECLSGGSTLDKALEKVTTDLNSASGRTALIIVSDGKQPTSSAISVAQALKARHGESICIYSVWVGNPTDVSGRQTLNELSDLGHCGFSTSSKTIYPATGFDQFMISVVLDK